MGGLGSRFGTQKLKPLITINGKPMFHWAEQSANNFVRIAFPNENHRFFGCINENYVAELNLLQQETGSKLTILPLPHQTRGPAESVYLSKLSLEEPLIIHDCDLVANPSLSQEVMNNSACDVRLFFTDSCNPHHSYIKLSSGVVSEVAEKRVISENGVVGIYYFKSKRFYNYLFEKTQFQGEYYISDVINTAIKLKYMVRANRVASCLSLGTPEEVSRNEARINSSFFEVDG
jgi:choline kinase